MRHWNFESVLDINPMNMKYESVKQDILCDMDALSNLIGTVKEEEKIVGHLRDVTLRLRYYFNKNS